MLIFQRVLKAFENFTMVSRSFLFKVLITGLFSIFTYNVNASPCNDVNRSLSNKRKLELAPKVAKELHLPSVEILQSFKSGKWDIIYVETHVSDETFLFYPSDPMKSPYITSWSGAAGVSEEQETKKWVLKNAPNIPLKLANCFAWHVTQDRDM